MSRPKPVKVEARCEFCRERITWAEWMPNPRARTVKGPQYVPIDYEPSDDQRARLALTARPGDRPLVGTMSVGQTSGWRAAGKPVFIEHAKTCVKADAMKRKLASRNARSR